MTGAIDWIARSKALEPKVLNFIDGSQIEVEGKALDKFAPRDGRLLCRFGAGTSEEVDHAVAVARRAFVDGRWSALSTQSRKDALYKLAALIETHRPELALLECLDVGKPIHDALSFDVPACAATIRHSAEAADYLPGKVYATDATSHAYQLRKPLGVVGAIVGWNFPLALAAQKIGPALITGNSLVLKPSEVTSLATARIAELAVAAGIPAGVFNVIHGNGTQGASLAHHPDVDLLTFTGSTATGKALLKASGDSNMKRLLLECGGKAANIVFDDCPDLDGIADAILARAFWNQGQVCTASSRLLVHQEVKQALLDKIAHRLPAWRMGDPLMAGTRFGALASRAHQEKVLRYIERGQAQGARLFYQAPDPKPFDSGFYVPPTLFEDVAPEHTIAQEEIFGPVLSVLAFTDESAAIRIANQTPYGLSCIAWTQSLSRAHRLTQQLNVGWLVVNATDRPEGGPGNGVLSIGGHKQSGFGVEGGLDGLHAYSTQSAIQLFA